MNESPKGALMYIEILLPDDNEEIAEMSRMATAILREHYDPIIGKEQNDYMLEMFQSENSIKDQIAHGYRYYFVREDDKDLGFFAFYRKKDCLYLSKLYLYKDQRGKGFSRQIIEMLKTQAKELGLHRIELNVNKNNPSTKIYEKLGFSITREEKNDIGHGYYMDDYVYAIDF